MEYLNTVNIITGVIVLLMLYFLKNLFTGDIGENRFFHIMAFVALCIGLYLWRSGVAVDLFTSIAREMGSAVRQW